MMVQALIQNFKYDQGSEIDDKMTQAGGLFVMDYYSETVRVTWNL